MKKTAAVFITALLFCICFSVLFGAFGSGISEGETITDRVEATVSENLPFKEKLSSLITGIRYASGRRYFDGIYIGSEGSLLYNKKNFGNYYEANAELLNFSEKYGDNIYFMLVPTSAAIREQEVDEYAYQGFTNQRSIMTDIYMELYGNLKTVDVYQTLYNHKNEYIFYRTEDIPTNLGGYYIYSSLGNRMGLQIYEQKDFSVAYLERGFYGSLAKEELKPYCISDFISVYEYPNSSMLKTLHYGTDGEITEMNGIYVQDTGDLENKTDILLGGISPITEIINEDKDENLLVFCDDTAKCWLPFMSLNFGKITAVNLSSVTNDMLSEIYPTNYDKIVFAFSLSDYSDGIDFSILNSLGYE